jgi:hypothetical protein
MVVGLVETMVAELVETMVVGLVKVMGVDTGMVVVEMMVVGMD